MRTGMFVVDRQKIKNISRGDVLVTIANRCAGRGAEKKPSGFKSRLCVYKARAVTADGRGDVASSRPLLKPRRGASRDGDR